MTDITLCLDLETQKNEVEYARKVEIRMAEFLVELEACQTMFTPTP